MPLLLPRSSKGTDLAERDDPALPAILEFQSPSTAVLSAPIPRSARNTVWIVTSLFVAVFLALALIRVDRVVTAQGEVVSKSPVLVVQPLETAIIREIDVRVGEKVRAGQVLARLDPTFAAADVGSLVAQVSSAQAMVSRLQAEVDGTRLAYSGLNPDLALQAAIYSQRKAEYDYKLENYKEKIDELIAQIKRANSDAEGYRSRLAVATDVEHMRRQLEKLNVGSKLNTLAAMDNRAEMERNYQSAMETAQAATRDLSAMIAERDGYVQSWHSDAAQQLADAVSKLADEREQLRKAQLRRQMVELRADRDATVLTIAKASVGSVLQSGEQFITLMPADAPLEVEANVAGEDAGYVRVGDPVAVKLDTFPFAQYGMAHGTLRILTANSFTAQDQVANQSSQVPISTNSTEPYYRARIAIDSINLHGVPADFELTPGMPVTADVKVGKRTILRYLLNRVVPTASDAMREP